MQSRINLHGIIFNQCTGTFKITGRFDSLNFSQQFTEQLTDFLIIIDYDIGLSVLLHHFDHFVGSSFFKYPAGNQLTVAHMSFFDIISRFDTYKLCHQTIHQESIIFSFISLCIRNKFQFYQFRVSHVVQSEQVGTCFFNSRTIRFQSVRVYSRKQFTRTMSQTFVQVCMKFTCQVAILVDPLSLFVIADKLFIEPVTVGSFIISICDIADSN